MLWSVLVPSCSMSLGVSLNRIPAPRGCLQIELLNHHSLSPVPGQTPGLSPVCTRWQSPIRVLLPR